MHILFVLLRLTNASGAWYLFWSGVYSALSTIGVTILMLRRYNCHWPKCPRVAWQPNPNGNGQMICRKHMPEAREAWHKQKMEHVRIRGVRYNRMCYHAHRRNPAAVS
jgi:hypothetical protein